MSEERQTHVHPLTKWAQGLLLDLDCDDESPLWREMSDVLARASEAAKDVEEERDAYREVLQALADKWAPGFTFGAQAAKVLARFPS